MTPVDRPESSGHLDLTKESDPDSKPSARGEAADIGIGDEEESGEETGWNVKLEIRASWRWSRRNSQSDPSWNPSPRTEAFIAPSIVLSGCVGTGATPATTLCLTVIAAAISIGTYRADRPNRS